MEQAPPHPPSTPPEICQNATPAAFPLLPETSISGLRMHSVPRPLCQLTLLFTLRDGLFVPCLLFGLSFSRRHLMFADLPVERGGASPPRLSVFCRELPQTTPEPRFCCSVPATSSRRSSTGSLVFLVRIVTFLCRTRGNDVRHKSFIFGVSLLLNSIFSA